MLQYRTYIKERSRYNTPPTLAIHTVGQPLKWITDTGNLATMAKRNTEKASLPYDFLDQSALFVAPVHHDSRSLMNVVFRCPTEELDTKFLGEVGKRDLEGLKGHRSAGGMRASSYNACPCESVVALVDFMKELERANPVG